MEKAPHYGAMFGQDVEPSGTYVLEKDGDYKINAPWVSGCADIKRPLIIDVNDETQISYKYDLANQYKAKGKKLTQKLMTKGYDAIITMRDGKSSEIILFPNCNFSLQPLNETKTLIQKLLKESLLPESIKGGSYNVFHGSPIKIENFVDDFVGGKEANDQEGPGIYFTTSKEEANRYGDNIYNVTLTPRLLFDQIPPNPMKLTPILTKLVRMAEDWEMSAQDYDENPIIGLNEFVKSTLQYNDNEKDCLLQVWVDFYRYRPIEYVRNCVSLGIDGIIVNKDYENTKHIIVYNPSIIKLT